MTPDGFPAAESFFIPHTIATVESLVQLLEADFVGVLTEAAAAHVEAVLADQSMGVGAATTAAALVSLQRQTPIAQRHLPHPRSLTELLRMRVPHVSVTHDSDREERASRDE